MVARKKKSTESVILGKLKAAIFSSRGFPLILTFTTLAVLFVLFRMKGIEMDYQISDVNKDIEAVTIENKELKAKKARLLSVNRLNDLADKYDLKQPDQDQIIVVP